MVHAPPSRRRGRAETCDDEEEVDREDGVDVAAGGLRLAVDGTAVAGVVAAVVAGSGGLDLPVAEDGPVDSVAGVSVGGFSVVPGDPLVVDAWVVLAGVPNPLNSLLEAALAAWSREELGC